MNAKDLILGYLGEAKVLQLAIEHNGQPWIANVYFVHDKMGNLYWLSTPERRHSVGIASNPKTAVSIVVKSDMPVIGIQAEGVAERVDNLVTIKNVMIPYVKKYGNGKELYKRALAGVNNHKLYRFTPKVYSLFDEVNFPKSAPQTWLVS